jgi:hypothetical protein
MTPGHVTKAHVDPRSDSDKPDFTGWWSLNTAKTNYGGYPGPSAYRRAISHGGGSISMVSEQSGGQGDGVNTLTVATDGKPVAVIVNQTPTIVTANWDGGGLIMRVAVESYRVEFMDRLHLSADGTELISEVEITSTQGKAALTIVFDRQ